MDQVFWINVAVYVLYVWSLIWKGLALWRASQFKQRNWFVVILILNTAGILEIIYLFRFSKKRLTWHEIKDWKKIFFTNAPEKK